MRTVTEFDGITDVAPETVEPRPDLLLGDGRALAAKTIDTTIDEATLRGEWADDLSSIRSDVTGDGPVPPSWIRSWLIDAALRRVVTNGSEILELGRTTRLANRAQRRALKHRDRGRRVPDCPRPSHWTDAHHFIAAHAGGPTNLANLARVCRRHHQMIHRGWTLHQDTAGTWHFDPTQEPGPPTVSLA